MKLKKFHVRATSGERNIGSHIDDTSSIGTAAAHYIDDTSSRVLICTERIIGVHEL